jgi:serine/tyrosine/threonine adenylyltransferase
MTEEPRQPAKAMHLPLTFDNSFVRQMPADPIADNYRRQVPDACFSLVMPEPVEAPQIIAWSDEVAELLGLERKTVGEALLAGVLSGNEISDGMQPFAACYGGHQFGNWAGQLGDGRAISLGEVINAAGQRHELQLKGAGPTPYSRMGDGRAVMRSSVREFLCSEAMHHLGVPSTRALSLVHTGDQVVRDMFYDGRPGPEAGAVVCRVAPTFLRFGNFQLLAARGKTELLKQLVDYAIGTHFAHLVPASGEINADVCLQWLAEVMKRTAEMVAHWMRVGFVHGVMNTDNMSILGLTIDYGPYGWLDNFDPNWTPNTTDASGRRYRYGHQPAIAGWNLARFAESLIPVVGAVEPLQELLGTYGDLFGGYELAMFGAKLGLKKPEKRDQKLISDALDLLGLVETDMTLWFRALADVPVAADATDEAQLAALQQSYYDRAPTTTEVREQTLAWLQRWTARLAEEATPADERKAAMNRVNPKFVLRNYTAQLAIDEAEKGDGGLVMQTLDVMRRPYDEQPGRESFAEKRPEWARTRAGCSMLSCSS